MTPNQENKIKTKVLLACDNNYDFMLANIIIGLKRWNDDIIDGIVVIYDNIDSLTRNKINSIWPEKIIFKNYTYKNFIQDIGEKNLYLIENLPLLKTHLIYARYYLFELLKDCDYAVWLEPDEIITGSIKNLIYETKEMCGAYWFTNRIENYLNDSTCQIPFVEKRKKYMLGGGFIVVNKTILLKTQNHNLTKECFEHLINYLKMRWSKKQNLANWDSAPGTDEMVFGILAYKYNLVCQDITKLANTLPGVSQKSNHTHFVIHYKAHNAIFLASYQEYLINNKIWVEKYGNKNKLEPKKTNIPIKSNSDLYTFLYNLECLSYIHPELSKLIADHFSHYKLYFSFYSSCFFDIYSSYCNNKLFFRIILPSCVREKLYIQIIFKDLNLKRIFLKQIISILSDYKVLTKGDFLLYDVSTFRIPMHSLQDYKIKNTCLIKSFRFNPYDSPIADRNIILDEIKKTFKKILKIIIPMTDIESHINKYKDLQNEFHSLSTKKQQLEIDILKQDLINKKLQTKQLSKKLGVKINVFTPRITMIDPNSAKARIQNHLSYKLGQAMIINSKSILGYIRMPFVLSYIKDKHKQEQKIYQEKIKQNPSLKLPPLESYPDYKEALKEKECFTYKLGEALIQANKTWYGGGYIKLLFEIRKIKREFKEKYANQNR
ncbi:glycosyltransferase [Campylobacter armoricus]|uniref:glycosyltransferase n=1 Tax=Campylobacter armoricus TaxID=2505970 RepID=UPI001116F98E|nr:glycosyltransferase [Campylobacter armoricus]